jgi:hypothetical protein
MINWGEERYIVSFLNLTLLEILARADRIDQ